MEWRKEEAKKMNEVDSCHSKRIRAFRNVAASDCLELALKKQEGVSERVFLGTSDV